MTILTCKGISNPMKWKARIQTTAMMAMTIATMTIMMMTILLTMEVGRNKEAEEEEMTSASQECVNLGAEIRAKPHGSWNMA